MWGTPLSSLLRHYCTVSFCSYYIVSFPSPVSHLSPSLAAFHTLNPVFTIEKRLCFFLSTNNEWINKETFFFTHLFFSSQIKLIESSNPQMCQELHKNRHFLNPHIPSKLIVNLDTGKLILHQNII